MGNTIRNMISVQTVIFHVKVLTFVTLAVAALSIADDEIVDASEFAGIEPAIVQVPSRFQRSHPKTAAKIMDLALLDASQLAQTYSPIKFYEDAQQQKQSLLQTGKNEKDCIKSAETTISSVLHEFKTIQSMINKLDDGCKCKEKGEYEVKRAAYRWRIARKEVITTTEQREESNSDSCKKEVTSKQIEKARMKEYLQAKEFALELKRQCRCAVINNEHKLVQFSQTMVQVRAKTVVRETVLICILKAESNKKSAKSCKSPQFIKSLETETLKRLTITQKKLCPGVRKTICGEKEKVVKEKKRKEAPVKEKQSKEGTVKEKKTKEKKDKEGGGKEYKQKEFLSKELKDKERRAKEVANKKEKTSKEAKGKETHIKEREGKEAGRKEKSTKERTSKEKRSKEGKTKEKKEKERTNKIELTKKEKKSKESKRKELVLKESKIKEERSKKEKKSKEHRSKELERKEEKLKEKKRKERAKKEKLEKEQANKEKSKKEVTTKEEDEKERVKKETKSKEKSKKEEKVKKEKVPKENKSK